MHSASEGGSGGAVEARPSPRLGSSLSSGLSMFVAVASFLPVACRRESVQFLYERERKRDDSRAHINANVDRVWVFFGNPLQIGRLTRDN